MAMNNYDDIKRALKPRLEFKASDDLRRRVNATIDRRIRKKTALRWLWGIGMAISAAALTGLLFIPTGMSAKEALTAALKSTNSMESVKMVAEIRTRPTENFRYISPDYGFVIHQINSVKIDSITYWRIDKGGRIAAGNDSDIYTWILDIGIGWHYRDTSADEHLGYLSVFLSPAKLLEAELTQCDNDANAEYRVTEKGEDILLTVKARRQGDFRNRYKLNASISESDNIRSYVIDRNSKRLKSASVSIKHGKQEITVLKIKSISYDSPTLDLTARPANIKFIDVSESVMPQGLLALSATEAASVLLTAFEPWDTAIINRAIEPELSDAMYKRHLQGAKLLSVGQSFESGNEEITFVPYRLKLADGSIKKHNLVLRKTPQEGWRVVGGL